MNFKPLLAALLCFCFLSAIKAQQFQYHLSFNSGFFHYKNYNVGYMNQVNLGNNTAYTNNPTSDKCGFSYGISVDMQRKTRYRLLYGVDAGFESLQSRQAINRTYGPFPLNYRTATGKTTFTRQFLNFYGFIGYSQSVKKITINLKFGYEYAAGLKIRDKGQATIVGIDSVVHIDKEIQRQDQNFDLRIRGQVEFFYKKVGLYVGYSKGLMNYYSGYIGASFEAYSRYTRLGIIYKIR